MNMHISIGDKFVAVKKVWFINEGTEITVTDTDEDGIISFTFGENNANNGYMDFNTFARHFEKVEEKNEDTSIFEVTVEEIATSVEEIMENSEFETHPIFDNSIVVSCRLPNGYVVTESYSCTSGNYDAELAEEICHDRIYDKIWELETYRFKQLIWEANMEEYECTCDGNCADCAYNEESNPNGLLN